MEHTPRPRPDIINASVDPEVAAAVRARAEAAGIPVSHMAEQLFRTALGLAPAPSRGTAPSTG